MIELEKEGSVGIVTMNNSAAKNSFDLNFAENFIERLAQADKECDAIVLTGVDGVFSAGYNIKILGKDQDATEKLVDLGGKIVLQLLNTRKPVVAACTGHAIALGAVILLGCDIRIAASGQFKFGLNETQLGFALPVFATELAKQRIPHQYLHRVILGAELYGLEQAQQYGFIDQIVDSDKVISESIALANRLAAYPSRAYAIHKKLLNCQFADAVQASLQN